MRLREFESDYGTGSTANVATMLNFLKKQSAKKGADGQISMAALNNLMDMSKFGGTDIHSYLADLQAKGLITDYDDKNVYYTNSDEALPAVDEFPMDDPMGAQMDPSADPAAGGDPLGPNLGEPTDPMAMNPAMGAPGGAPGGEPAMPSADPMMGASGMMGGAPDPVPGMAQRALARRS